MTLFVLSTYLESFLATNVGEKSSNSGVELHNFIIAEQDTVVR